MQKQEIKKLKVKDLHLWSENPRDPIDSTSSDFDIINRALKNDNNKWNLQKFISRMGAYYDFSELPTVVKIKKKYIVYDGNRRVAILKYLQNQELYSKLGGGLFFNEEPKEFRELLEIPCNVCDKDTALKNIERKHTNNGTWNELERDYFLHLHRDKEKSPFLWFEEQTKIISENPKMNKRFVKEEVLTIENLDAIGFKFNSETGFSSNYSKEDINEILNGIVNLIETGNVSTRNNRSQLLNPLKRSSPKLKESIKPFDKKKKKNQLKPVKTENKNSKHNIRKTSRTKTPDRLFGETLSLKKGEVNDFYIAISNIYDKNKNDDVVLKIIGMSLRLLLEVAARVVLKNQPVVNKDKIYDVFLHKAKNEMSVSQKRVNFLTLTNDWLGKSHNLEALLGKLAHGNITTLKSDILKNSFIIADILKFYFKK